MLMLVYSMQLLVKLNSRKTLLNTIFSGYDNKPIITVILNI